MWMMSMVTSVFQNPFSCHWIMDGSKRDSTTPLQQYAYESDDYTLKDLSEEDEVVINQGYTNPSMSSPDLQDKSFEGDEDEVDFNFLPRRNSECPPIVHRTHSFDANLFNFRQVSADKIAEQLTLIDLALLKSIPIEEFHGCKFEKKDKLTSAPNISNFSRRFNHTSFWVVRDILNESSPKIRAEIIVQFLRIARHLQELNNIHSLVAMVLAIESPPIYRLTRTWKLVPKKDKVLLERLSEFISGEENYFTLRNHMSKLTLPCIPHLGLHQKDLVYLDTLLKSSRATEEDKLQAKKKSNEIHELISKCQSSRYDTLMPVIHIQKYLNSLRYIDELQKFYEEENYKLSLQVEPNHKASSVSVTSPILPPPPIAKHLRNSKSQEDLLSTPLKPEVIGMFTPPRRPINSRFSESTLSSKRNPSDVPLLNVTEEHVGNSMVSLTASASPQRNPKIKTLPVDMREMSIKDLRKEGTKSAEPHTNNGVMATALEKKVKSASPSTGFRKHRGHSKSQSVGTNVLTVLGIPNSRNNGNKTGGSSPDLPPHPISLLDDSFLDDSTQGPNVSSEPFTPTISTASSSSLDVHSFDEETEVFLQDTFATEDGFPKDSEVIREGILKRRVIAKNGHTKQLKVTHKYWVKLTEKSIILVPKKYKDSPKKPDKLKGFVLTSCRVKYEDPSIHIKSNQFLVVDDRGNQTKFKASTKQEAAGWVNDIREAIDKISVLKKKHEQEKPLIRL